MNRFIERVNIDHSKDDMVKNLTKLIEKKHSNFNSQTTQSMKSQSCQSEFLL